MILDYDPGEVAMSRHELWDALLKACPTLAGSAVLWWCSGSSYIYEGETERQGLRGQRFYVTVENAGDLERAGKVLAQRLWLGGFGFIKVSTDGKLLVRSLFDEAMHQPARLDYCGGAICEPPLRQHRPAPLVQNDGAWLDTAAALPDLTGDELRELQGLQASAKDAKRGEAAKARAAYAAKMESEIAQGLLAVGVTLTEATERASEAVRAAFNGELLADFVLYVAREDSSGVDAVTVGQVLDQRDRFHGCAVLPPMNPGHRGGKGLDAILYLKQATPILYCLDSDGRFRLRRARHAIEVRKGDRGALVQGVVRALLKQDDLFMLAGGPALVTEGRAVPLDDRVLRNLADARLSLASTHEGKKTAHNLTQEQAQLVLTELRTCEGLRPLVAVHSLPFVTPTGRVVTIAGYDAETRVYLHVPPDYAPRIGATREAAREALQTMMAPFLGYRWSAGPHAAAAIAAVLTAVSRPVLPLAPMVVVDANTYGSGKTKMATALGAILTGAVPAVATWSGPNEEEMRKWLLAEAIQGQTFLCLDNVTGRMDSAVLAGLLTSGRVTGRVLQQSETRAATARALLTITANNVDLGVDLIRRGLVIRIDGGAAPAARRFNFDPVQVALRDRVRIAEAACTLMAAYFSAGAPAIAKDDAGGFVDWVKLCRQPVLWAACEGLADGLGWELGDPGEFLLRDPAAADTEAQAFLDVLRGVHHLSCGDEFHAREVARWANAASNEGSSGLIREGLDALMPGRREHSPLSVSRALSNRVDRFFAGYVLRSRRDTGANATVYRVCSPAG
ncbi:hypothetical protein [Caldimonas tepidiphila]|uniref:hypothetical protein n=1 Tax=Caldimonas tepidiphila TaxID=2315841 RepID=UPI001300913C|nr:hypothetical protein [Caldimonas tepidiphila]